MNLPARPFFARAARGFTLIEVMLAAVLGLIVILVAAGLFRVMDVAKQTQAQRMENNLEFASAHRILQQSFRTLLMSDAADPKDDELKQRIIGDLESAAADREDTREEDTGSNRFALQPDPTKIDMFNRPVQTLEVTLKVPPVRGNVRSMDAAELRDREQQLIERFRRGDSMFLSMDNEGGSIAGTSTRNSRENSRSDARGRAAADDALAAAGAGRESDRASSRRESSGGRDRETRRASLRESASQFAGREISEDALSGLLEAGDEPARAPGVRGVFELRPEVDPNVLRRAREQGDPEGGRGLWAMWWREFPADAADGADSAELAELARYSRSDVREVKLISGLRQARWQVFRTSRGEKLERARVAKIAAVHARELPAFIELKFETVDGRREHWMFEIAWSSGPEPGSIVQGGEEALSAEEALRLERDRARETPRQNQTSPNGPNAGPGDSNGPSKGHQVDLGPK